MLWQSAGGDFTWCVIWPKIGSHIVNVHSLKLFRAKKYHRSMSSVEKFARLQPRIVLSTVTVLTFGINSIKDIGYIQRHSRRTINNSKPVCWLCMYKRTMATSQMDDGIMDTIVERLITADS